MSIWRTHGVRVMRAESLDAETPGVTRHTAVNFPKAGARSLWAGTFEVAPGMQTGVYHHGPAESVIFVVSGSARIRWGERLQYMMAAGPGDFIYIPPYVPHQEINASKTEPLACVMTRSDEEAEVVNIDIAPAGPATEIEWRDPTPPVPGV